MIEGIRSGWVLSCLVKGGEERKDKEEKGGRTVSVSTKTDVHSSKHQIREPGAQSAKAKEKALSNFRRIIRLLTLKQPDLILNTAILSKLRRSNIPKDKKPLNFLHLSSRPILSMTT